MKNKLFTFISERSDGAFTPLNIKYLCLGGSIVIGTSDQSSDIDARGIVSPTEDNLYGLNNFDMTKLIEGNLGVNSLGDADIELYSIRKFMQSIYRGDVVTSEMLFIEDPFKFVEDPNLTPIFSLRELFLTKALVKNYSNFAFGMYQKAFNSRINDSERKDKIERLEKYGYETKYAMKSFLYFTMCLEILGGKGLILTRPDASDLLAIKNGKYSVSEMRSILAQLDIEVKSLLSATSLVKTPNFNVVNDLCKSVIKSYL
jgi:predicted nucleotidyltransferase